ncbi:MAG TPA: hypothetical protein ENJ80_10735 [Gammaproteobacteria bacterium]|nr:hypothetical protein [Gammaproteobacteria bacterium]
MSGVFRRKFEPPTSKGEKVTYRLAQRPGSYVVLKYVRQGIKRNDTGAILAPPAPANGHRGYFFPCCKKGCYTALFTFLYG